MSAKPLTCWLKVGAERKKLIMPMVGLDGRRRGFDLSIVVSDRDKQSTIDLRIIPWISQRKIMRDQASSFCFKKLVAPGHGSKRYDRTARHTRCVQSIHVQVLVPQDGATRPIMNP